VGALKNDGQKYRVNGLGRIPAKRARECPSDPKRARNPRAETIIKISMPARYLYFLLGKK
jgi:hypothetical protein